jgi:hypothetical protein
MEKSSLPAERKNGEGFFIAGKRPRHGRDFPGAQDGSINGPDAYILWSKTRFALRSVRGRLR